MVKFLCGFLVIPLIVIMIATMGWIADVNPGKDGPFNLFTAGLASWIPIAATILVVIIALSARH